MAGKLGRWGQINHSDSLYVVGCASCLFMACGRSACIFLVCLFDDEGGTVRYARGDMGRMCK